MFQKCALRLRKLDLKKKKQDRCSKNENWRQNEQAEKNEKKARRRKGNMSTGENTRKNQILSAQETWIRMDDNRGRGYNNKNI